MPPSADAAGFASILNGVSGRADAVAKPVDPASDGPVPTVLTPDAPVEASAPDAPAAPPAAPPPALPVADASDAFAPIPDPAAIVGQPDRDLTLPDAPAPDAEGALPAARPAPDAAFVPSTDVETEAEPDADADEPGEADEASNAGDAAPAKTAPPVAALPLPVATPPVATPPVATLPVTTLPASTPPEDSAQGTLPTPPPAALPASSGVSANTPSPLELPATTAPADPASVTPAPLPSSTAPSPVPPRADSAQPSMEAPVASPVANVVASPSPASPQLVPAHVAAMAAVGTVAPAPSTPTPATSVPTPPVSVGPQTASVAPPKPGAPETPSDAVPVPPFPTPTVRPARNEALALLQLARDHLHGRVDPSTTPKEDAIRPAAWTGSDTPLAALARPADGAAPSPSFQPAPTTQPMPGLSVAPPPIDIAASLGAQVVDMGVSGQWIDGLAKDIAGLTANGAQGRFQINADQLGLVQVDIRQNADGAAVSLTVASEMAEQALRQDSDRLKLDATLAAVRINEVRVERAPHVAEAGRSASSDNQSSSSSHQNTSQHGQQQGRADMGGQSSAQQHMPGRGQARENIASGLKGGGDGAVLNHGQAGGDAGDVPRARYA